MGSRKAAWLVLLTASRASLEANKEVQNRGWNFLDTAVKKTESGDNTGALREIQKALDLLPRHVPIASSAHLMRGQIFAQQGKGDRALKSLRESIALNNVRKETYNVMAKVMEVTQHSELPEAELEAYDAVLKIDPHDAENHFLLGNSIQRLGERAGVRNPITAWKAAVDANPSHDQSYANIAGALVSRDTKSTRRRAGTSARKAVNINPKLWQAYMTLARSKFTNLGYKVDVGDPEDVLDAQIALDTTLELHPAHAHAYFLSAILMGKNKKSDHNDTVACLYEALAIDPSNTGYREAWEKMQKQAPRQRTVAEYKYERDLEEYEKKKKDWERKRAYYKAAYTGGVKASYHEPEDDSDEAVLKGIKDSW